MSLDGTCLDVADTPANEQEFGRPGSSRREAGGAFPQLRLVALSETGTHAICAAAMGPLSRSERELADELLGGLAPEMLCLADRGFYSFQRFQTARETGAQLLWRVTVNMVLPREQQLPDGSYLTRIYANQPDQRAHRDGHQVRVVEYQLDDGLSDPEQRYRLLTTILEPEHAPAVELGVLYHERWEIENALDELKVHQRGPRVVLRSKATGRRLPGSLRIPVHPLRDPPADARRRTARRPRSRPIVVHPQPPGRPPQRPHPAGIFPP